MPRKISLCYERGQKSEAVREGRRRNATIWTYSNVPQSFLFDQGYTGHEHLDQFGLINMNGRIYDPQLGRFLSPDPFVTSPENPQNYNRYSYVLNNPLKYTDPSGYSRITNIINTLWSYDHGGTWTLGGGFHKFESHDEAFEASIDYVNTTNSWGNTANGSEQASRTIYNMIKNINYNYDINRNTVMHQGENRQYHFGYDRSTHTFYYVGTDTEVNPFEIIFGDDAANGGGESQGFFSDGVWTLSLTGTASGGIIGVSGEIGITLDFRNGFQIGAYTTIEHALGADWTAGAVLNYHKPVANTSNFGVSDLNGWSETYNGGFLIFDGTYGGNATNQGLDPNNYSDYHSIYNTYGLGMSIGSPVGFTRNKGYTWTSPTIGW
jgi:RHS repeat-associated protein